MTRSPTPIAAAPSLSPPLPAPSGSRRTLADFGTLLPAETLLLAAARDGAIARIGLQRPRAALPVVRVRAEFLAWLARGGPEAGVTGHRLQLLGACLVGTLDLRDSVVPASLWLYRCVVVRVPQLGHAQLRGSLSFRDCVLPGLQAEGCRIDGDLELNAGCQVGGELNLAGASTGLDLNCERLQLRPSPRFGDASPCRLAAEGLRVGGSVRLGGAEVQGGIDLRSARIRRDLEAGGARLSADLDDRGARGLALCLACAVVGGSVRLNAGVSVAGQVDLERIRIGADLDGDGADVDPIGDAGWGGTAALRLDRARIGGALKLRQLLRPLDLASLVDARVATLADDAATWGRGHRLDGFHYRRLAPGSPTDAAMRLGWLARQESAAPGSGFASGPWRRLVKVLRRAGHAHAASQVAIGYQRQLRVAGGIGLGAPAAARWLMRGAHACYGLVCGYGHRPLRLVGALAGLWLVCGAVYWAAGGEVGAGAGAGFRARAGAGTDDGAGALAAAAPAGAPRFHPFILSLELLLPGIDLGQARRAAAAATATGSASSTMATGPVALLMGVEAICGWLALAAVIGAAGGAAAVRDLRD